MSSAEESTAHWQALAEANWLLPSKSKKPRVVRTELIKSEIWDVLEREGFPHRCLLALENLHLLENLLWPGFDDASSDHHALLIALMVNVRRREGLPAWTIFASNLSAFSSLFRRLLALSVDSAWSPATSVQILIFIIGAFQSLDVGYVRKECAPLVSISIWHHLDGEHVREQRFEAHPQLRKAWSAAARRFDAADGPTQSRLTFERSWLYSLIVKFVNALASDGVVDSNALIYCERFLELLSDLESQLPTRRYVNALLEDLNLLALIHTSPLFNAEGSGLLRDLSSLLQHYMHFAVDDQSGSEIPAEQWEEFHSRRLANLQRQALQQFKEKLMLLALSNYGTIEQKSELEGHLSALSDDELKTYCQSLGLRTQYSKSMQITVTRQLLLEAICNYVKPRVHYQDSIRKINILPTQDDLYEESLLRNENYDGSRPLAIPKINLQYLTMGDFLWRNFLLHRCESFFEIRNDLEETMKRLQPRLAENGQAVRFDGTSRMALPISRPAILEIAPSKVGSAAPGYVRAEIVLEVGRLSDHVRADWDALRPYDVVFLAGVRPVAKSQTQMNGHEPDRGTKNSGLKVFRAAEVVQVLDEGGKALRDVAQDDLNGYRRPRKRRMIINIDSTAFAEDQQLLKRTKHDVYDDINLVMRRSGRENNFRQILKSIQSLALSDTPLPRWLQDVLLGYGDPASASFSNLPGRLRSVDMRDTFLDWSHLLASFPDQTIKPTKGHKTVQGPPFVLETQEEPLVAERPAKKRRREARDPSVNAPESFCVSTYKQPNSGPYPSDQPKVNQVRFTPTQTRAIYAGTQPGLTVIVGPPGTGKTDVATQVVSNLYHDFPHQRILLIAHSNQALNQLFQKITNLDIDARHLLRLGHGEGELDTDASYGKQGRVESFLDNRAGYLAEVTRLAANLNAPGAHGNSCETAGYFHSVFVVPAWKKFWATAESELDPNIIKEAFPFDDYFSNASQPLFSEKASKKDIVDIAKGCERHIAKIFSELEDIRPFEILRNPRDQANYLLIKEARIVAMTTTHAAIRRQEIADLGFRYDSVVMEEAAQITEIEDFIPLAMQRPRDGDMPVQRVVLCGDHLQNSPIVQNMAFRQFANLEQSLFLRLVRLGVPAIELDQQGRARPSIAALYSWRYGKLGNLPVVLESAEFQRANAGLRFEYQFIDVPDYKGHGEMQPTPHFIQNLGEAEYAVALYQYMRLLGYPAAKISILTMYAGQRALIRDVLQHRCARHRLFGLPKIVSTVDKYQGEQNDYVILSMVRTNRVGYLRDIRRLTVALSRARLGLYILGRREIFEASYELREAFERLLQRPTTLQLVTGEMFPTSRRFDDDEVQAVEMTGVEHLGQYVYEMTQAKMNIQNGNGPALLEASSRANDIAADPEQAAEE